MTHVQSWVAVNILLEDTDGDVVFLRRKGGWGHGKLAPVAGHLEFGESWEECAAREVKEETGLSCTEKELEFLHVMYRIDDAGNCYTDIFYRLRIGDRVPENKEPTHCSELLILNPELVKADEMIYFLPFFFEQLKKGNATSSFISEQIKEERNAVKLFVHLILQDESDRILMFNQPQDAINPHSYWKLPGGKIDIAKGENFCSAATRIAAETMELELSQHLLALSHVVQRQISPGIVFIDYYVDYDCVVEELADKQIPGARQLIEHDELEKESLPDHLRNAFRNIANGQVGSSYP